MAQQVILTDDARQTFRTVLDGQSVRVTVWWQPDDESWYISLAWLDRRPIVSGVRLVSGGFPLRRVETDFLGELYVSGPNTEPMREAWSTTHEVLYLTREELGV